LEKNLFGQKAPKDEAEDSRTLDYVRDRRITIENLRSCGETRGRLELSFLYARLEVFDDLLASVYFGNRTCPTKGGQFFTSLLERVSRDCSVFDLSG